MRRILFVLFAVAPFVAAAQDGSTAAGGNPGAPTADGSAPAASAFHGVQLGVGAGPSVLSFDVHEGDLGSTLRIRVGVARSPRVAFGFEGGLSVSDSAQLGSSDVGVTFSPWQGSFYVRGGAGLTTLAFRDGRGERTERGGNMLVGLGLALGSAHGANVTINIDAQYHRTSAVGDSFFGHQAGSASAWLGVEWR